MKIIYTCLIIIFALIVSFFMNAALIWVICSCLPLIGITVLFGWTIQFSWPLAFIIWAIELIIGRIFKTGR